MGLVTWRLGILYSKTTREVKSVDRDDDISGKGPNEASPGAQSNYFISAQSGPTRKHYAYFLLSETSDCCECSNIEIWARL